MNAPLPALALDRAARQREIVAALAPLVPAHALLWQAEDTVPYECDGLTAYRQLPAGGGAARDRGAGGRPCSRPATRWSVPVVARGAGTGLSGGAMPHAMGVTLSLAKFNKILQVDADSRTAVVQCGVRNLAISEAAAPLRPVLRARPVAARSPAPSAATWPKTPAACTA